jgi:hypothetical protein
VAYRRLGYLEIAQPDEPHLIVIEGDGAYLNPWRKELPMFSDKRLIAWSSRWMLVGNHVLCGECMASQAARDAGQSFVHIDCDLDSGSSEYPWHDLREILTDLPSVPN